MMPKNQKGFTLIEVVTKLTSLMCKLIISALAFKPLLTIYVPFIGYLVFRDAIYSTEGK